jgi:hypothetical protein
MATRTYQLIGKVYGDSATAATVSVKLNGTQEFLGDVTPEAVFTTVDALASVVVCQWQTDGTETGDGSTNVTVPVEISVTNGDLVFENILMNQIHGSGTFSFKPDAVWVNYTPATIDDLDLDRKNLSTEEFTTKYGFAPVEIYSRLDIVVNSDRQTLFVDPWSSNYAESDGRDNVKIDGVPNLNRKESGATQGTWKYVVLNGQTLTCDLILPKPWPEA